MKLNKKITFILLTIGLSVIAIISLITYKKDVVISELNSFKLLPIPENYTELYFENAQSLPSKAIKGVPAVFDFTIHNVEHKTVTYPYSVYFEYASGHREVFITDYITLEQNGHATIHISHVFMNSDLHGKVVVELTSKNQTIDFLLPNNNYNI